MFLRCWCGRIVISIAVYFCTPHNVISTRSLAERVNVKPRKSYSCVFNEKQRNNVDRGWLSLRFDHRCIAKYTHIRFALELRWHWVLYIIYHISSHIYLKILTLRVYGTVSYQEPTYTRLFLYLFVSLENCPPTYDVVMHKTVVSIFPVTCRSYDNSGRIELWFTLQSAPQWHYDRFIVKLLSLGTDNNNCVDGVDKFRNKHT